MAWERLQEKLQEGSEKLVNKLLNFCERSAAEPGLCADSTPYRKNLAKVGDLTLKEIKFLFQAFHGSAWAEHISRTVRLASCRSLLAWALDGDTKDSLPGTTMGDLRDKAVEQYLKCGP